MHGKHHVHHIPRLIRREPPPLLYFEIDYGWLNAPDLLPAGDASKPFQGADCPLEPRILDEFLEDTTPRAPVLPAGGNL